MLDECRRHGPRWRLWGALAVTLTAAFGCKEDERARPGYVSDCNDTACVDARGNMVPTPISGSPGAAGAAGAGGDAGMPPPSAGTLAGNVFELDSSDLASRSPLTSPVEVRAPGTSGNEPVIGQAGAGGTFRLDGVRVGQAVWVGVGQFQMPPAEPFMDTLQAVDLTREDFADLLVVRREVLRDLAAASFLEAPVELDPTLAHVVVRFVRPGGGAIPGVHISIPLPEQVPTAYDAGDIYSDALEETSQRGMALLLNMPAPAYPGITTSLVAEVAGEQLAAELPIAAGAVTLVSAVVPDP